jgi:hypothetical protein
MKYDVSPELLSDGLKNTVSQLIMNGSIGESIVDSTSIIERIAITHTVERVTVRCAVSPAKYTKNLFGIIFTITTITDKRREKKKLFTPFFSNPTP